MTRRTAHAPTALDLPRGAMPAFARLKSARADYQAANLAWWETYRAGSPCGAIAAARAAAWARLVSLGAPETL